MKVNKEQLHQKLEKEFYFKSMINIAEKVLSSIDYQEVKDDKELYNKISQTIKSKLIYSCECWEVMQYYQTPVVLLVRHCACVLYHVQIVIIYIFYNHNRWPYSWKQRIRKGAK